MARSRPKPFDVLVTLDIDRVGRDGVHTVPKLAEVLDQGVRVFFYQTGEEVSVKTPMDVFMLQARAFAAADYRHQVRVKTWSALRSKAEHGYVAGGKVLGYANEPALVDGKKAGIVRRIDPDQAEIVRRIFELAASGKGLLKIARVLNEEGVENPTGQDRIDRGGKQKPKGKWATTGIRDVLRRELYIGKVVYGKTRWEDRGGTKLKVAVPEAEWLVREVPELRIVPDDLWHRTRSRIEKTHALYLRRNGGRLASKPESGLESKYLLSGFLRAASAAGT